MTLNGRLLYSTDAMKSAKNGLKVGIADFRPYGGTCALRGCDPKKILIDVAKAKSKFVSTNALGILRGKGRNNPIISNTTARVLIGMNWRSVGGETKAY